MDDEELESYWFGEMVLSDKQYHKSVEDGSAEPSDFYNILLEEPFGSSISGDYSYYLPFLPLFKKFIFHIPPVPSEEEFQIKFGMSVSQILELDDRNKSFLLLEKNPLDTPYPEYMDPILNRKPQVYEIRNEAYHRALNELWNRHLAEGTDNYLGLTDHDLRNLVISTLRIHGNGSFADNLEKRSNFKKGDPSYDSAMGNLQKIYTNYMLGPLDNSLGGISIAEESDLYMVPNAIPLSDAISIGNKKSPCPLSCNLGIGKCLIEQSNLHIPHDLGLLLEIESKPFHEAYVSLHSAIESKNPKTVCDRAIALSEALKETNEIIDSMERRRRPLQNAITSITVGAAIVGALAQSLPGNPMFNVLSAMGGALGAAQIFASPMARKIVQLNKPDHVIFISNTRG